jgi:hypothetical protein
MNFVSKIFFFVELHYIIHKIQEISIFTNKKVKKNQHFFTKTHKILENEKKIENKGPSNKNHK